MLLLFFFTVYFCNQLSEYTVIKLVRNTNIYCEPFFSLFFFLPFLLYLMYIQLKHKLIIRLKKTIEWVYKWHRKKSSVIFDSRWVVPHIPHLKHQQKPQCFHVFSSSATQPLGLLQWLIVILQHSPSLWCHEAIGRILSLAGHLPHTCTWDEIIILMAERKRRE